MRPIVTPPAQAAAGGSRLRLLRGGTRGRRDPACGRCRGRRSPSPYSPRNVVANLQRLGVQTGFGFLERPAGFDISQTLIALWRALDLSDGLRRRSAQHARWSSRSPACSPPLLGFLIGLGRLSSNGLVAAAAGLYVETFRNIPLLIQLLFWYFAVLRPLPGPRESLSLRRHRFSTIAACSCRR